MTTSTLPLVDRIRAAFTATTVHYAVRQTTPGMRALVLAVTELRDVVTGWKTAPEPTPVPFTPHSETDHDYSHWLAR